MEKRIRRSRIVWLLALMLLALAGLCIPAQAAQDAGVQVMIDGQPLKADVAPQIINGRTMVPLRAIFEALGLRLDWYPAAGIIKASKTGTAITLQVGQKQAVLNDKIMLLESPPIVIQSRTLVPVRFIAESSGKLVEWDAAQQIVWIGQVPSPSETAKQEEPAKEVSNVEKSAAPQLTTKALSEDTEMPYREGKKALFARGDVTIDANGYVRKGKLAQDTLLTYRGQAMMRFKGGNDIEFFDDGTVSQGVLKEDQEIEYAPKRACTFQNGTKVVLRAGGYAKSGILQAEAKFNYNENSIVIFEPGYETAFYDDGMVAKGVLHSDLSLPYRLETDYVNVSYPEFRTKNVVFMGLTAVEFSEKGLVISGTVRDDSEVYFRKDETLWLKKETTVAFNEQQLLDNGVLKDDKGLEIKTGDIVNFGDETRVSFDEQGYVTRGTTSGNQTLKSSADNRVMFPNNTVLEFDVNGYAREIKS